MAPTVVLVHGAWHGAWCWERVVAGLEARGVATVAIDLPGHGDDPGPATDFAGDVAAVEAAIDAVGRPVVLVGHSYGGLVVTDAGALPAVTHLVYLCAFAVEEGESCANAGGDEAAGIDHTGRPDLSAELVHLGDSSTTVPAEGARRCFYGDCDEPTAAWAIERLCPQRLENLLTPPSRIAWRSTPSTYVVCTEDLAVHPELQRIMARRCTNAIEWETSHSPFLSRPDLVVDLLEGLAAA